MISFLGICYQSHWTCSRSSLKIAGVGAALSAGWDDLFGWMGCGLSGASFLGDRSLLKSNS